MKIHTKGNEGDQVEEKSKDPAAEQMLCPIRYALGIVGGKWKLPILCMLVSGRPARYSVMKRKLGDVTNMMLAQSLKELEAAGMVHREQYNEVPPRVEYSLTEKGNSIVPILIQLAGWGEDHLHKEQDGKAGCDNCQAAT